MYNVVKHSIYPPFNDDCIIIASFDNEKEALVCKIEKNWIFMAKYKSDEVANLKEDFNWEEYHPIFIGTNPSIAYVIPILNEVLITYDIKKLEHISKNQSKYFQEGSSVYRINKIL